MVLGGQPLVPEMLNRVVAKFNPRRADGIGSSSSSSSGAANGKISSSQMVQLKNAAAGKAAAEQQEQEDAQVGEGEGCNRLWACGAVTSRFDG